MPRVKVKQKVSKSSLFDKDTAKIFEEYVLNDMLDVDLCYSRFFTIEELLKKLVNLVIILRKLPCIRDNDRFARSYFELVNYCENATDFIKEKFLFRFSSMIITEDDVDPDEKQEFEELYIEIKKSDLVADFIATGNEMVNYRTQIEQGNYKFIEMLAGVEFTPLTFSKLNFKQVLASEQCDESQKEMIMSILKKIMVASTDLYKEITKPDYDTDKFVEIILQAIEGLQKQIPRCEKAFRKIKNSAQMLRDNFGEYHKDFLHTNNPMMIMENYVMDIASSSNTDAETIRQIKKILDFTRKNTSGKNMDPAMKKQYDKMYETFNDKMSNYEEITKTTK